MSQLGASSMVRVRVESPYQGVEGTALYVALDEAGSPVSGPCAAVIGMTHGNEIVGEAVLRQLERDVFVKLRQGSLLLVRSNLEGQRIDKRHSVGGTDINRLWDADQLARIRAMSPESMCYEHRRVLELAPLLEPADAILDLHSSSRPAPPFMVFRDDQRHADIASRLGVPFLVTGLHESAVLDGGMTPEVGLRPGERSARVGFLFESGQHLDPTNLARAHAVTERFLAELGVWSDAPPPPADVRPKVYEIIDRAVQAPAGATPFRFVGYVGGEPGSGRNGPPRPLASFDEIEADEVLLRRGRSEVVRAHMGFSMLLPTPNADPGTDLYYVAIQRPAPRGALRTHGGAKAEAVGIERMLDILADDEFSRGTTFAAFDGRQALDWCADLVARTLRMPADHPHRRVTIVGAGQWAGDEAERRAGHRYRAAMRRVLQEGVPVDRFQLLRGASLGWFRSLTAPSMGRIMDRRGRKAGGSAAGGMRLYLSARQPHSVSLLIVGDIDRALREGDFRDVRVALLVEAATAEADGPTARVRVVRLGLFSARPEMLGASARLLDVLREEHRYLVRRAPVGDDPALVALLGEDGAIEPRADARSLDALRDALYRLQLRLWREVLPPETLQPRRLGGPAEVGQWLARTMASTGILDGPSLAALLVDRDDDGVAWVDPSRLEAAAGDRHPVLPDAITVEAGRAIPPQPLVAEDVDADEIERWIGWKRFLRTAQIVPDTRGKDVDLAFDDEGIAAQAGALIAKARELAAKMPGRVMLCIAGHGMKPDADGEKVDRGALFASAHSRALLDPNLRYVRIQHAQGTHLGWIKGVLAVLAERPATGEPVALQWEAAHGTSVNVLLVAVRDEDAPDRPWTLEGWTVDCCSVLITHLRGTGARDYRVGVFAETRPDRAVNAELLHFGRAHCEALLSQAGPRVAGEAGPAWAADLERVVADQLTTWVERVRAWRHEPVLPPPTEPSARARWVAGQLGITDLWLARGLADEMDGDRPAREVAARLWETVPGF